MITLHEDYAGTNTKYPIHVSGGDDGDGGSGDNDGGNVDDESSTESLVFALHLI